MKIKYIVTFIAGGLVGSLASYIYLDKKFKEDLDREVKEYEKMFDSLDYSDDSETEPTEDKENSEQAERIINYSQYRNDELNSVKERIEHEFPEIISCEQYGELEEYDCDSLYFDGKELRDDNGEIVSKELIGDEAVSLLIQAINGNINEDTLYVRNNLTQMDYEVIIDEEESSW